MATRSRLPIQALPDYLASRGRYSATLEEVQELTGSTYAAAVSGLGRLHRQGRVFSPARGLYVFVPAEYRSWRVTPADWFVDDLMRHLQRPYYVALLSAAVYHGASHHAPQVFQIMTDRHVADRDIERVRLRFYTTQRLAAVPRQSVNTQTGTIWVSSPEATVVDLVDHPRASGGISNVATVVRDIGELNSSQLATLAAERGLACARRTGWLAERFGRVEDLGPLRLAARLGEGDPSVLSPTAPRRGRTDQAWHVRVNTEVEPDR